MKKTETPFCYLLTAILVMIHLSFQGTLKGQVVGGDSTGNFSSKDIRTIVLQDRKAAATWWNAWLVGYSAATVTQAGIAMTSPKLATRQDMWNGAATTFLGAIGILFTPLVPKKAEVETQMTSENQAGHIFNSDDYNIAYLKEIARREKFGRSWKVHAIAGVVDAGSGLVAWLGFDRKFTDGLITFAINTVVAEAQIWSQPIRAKRDYENIMRSRGKGRNAASSLSKNQWTISAFPGGACLKIQF